MTDKDRQELRKWSARLMGYSPIGTDENGDLVVSKKEEYEGDVYDYFFRWAPDLPESPAWQCDSVVERMREFGWYLNLVQQFDGLWFCSFMDEKGLQNPVIADTRQLATLIAAKATGVEL